MLASRVLGILGVCAFCALTGSARCSAGDIGLTSGVDRSAFDASVKPGENFFLYVNGTWIRHNPIPAEYADRARFPTARR